MGLIKIGKIARHHRMVTMLKKDTPHIMPPSMPETMITWKGGKGDGERERGRGRGGGRGGG